MSDDDMLASNPGHMVTGAEPHTYWRGGRRYHVDRYGYVWLEPELVPFAEPRAPAVHDAGDAPKTDDDATA